jgi:hypothetical protein
MKHTITLPAETWEKLPAYLTPADPVTGRQAATNVWPVGYVTERNADGSPACHSIPVQVTGSEERAAQVVDALNLATSPEVADARAVLAMATEGKTLTGNAARLALRLSALLDRIDGKAGKQKTTLAAAAPDMFAALDALLCHPVGIDTSASKIAAARAALAKAKEGQA